MFLPLSYTWYVNNTRLDGVATEIYSFIVTKDIKYNQYTCQSKENLESEKSKEIRVNPLYGPESVMINPQPLNDTITIKNGEPFGPYTCSADCNPPCTLQWKYKHPSGDFVNYTPHGISPLLLPKQNADRTRMTLVRCVANNSEGRKKQGIKLNILYSMDPQVYINKKIQNSSIMNEDKPLSLTCLVRGNPTPKVTLKNLTGDKIIGENPLYFTFKTVAKCSDTGTYSCQGKSTEFGSRNQSFHINVSCAPRLDDSILFKSIYGSKSGPNVNVDVSLPVIANPLTSTSEFSWSGPTSESISIKVSQRDNVIYKHWINSTIPVPTKRSFGNYTLTYKGEVFVEITINAE
ncbi:hemicentin-1-like, partial [Saccostrea echinata]|uniref:hemicentin-1-like n=1 Tax=Saccostrea echinata TaxID=191078 RepID=UPI002A81DB6B